MAGQCDVVVISVPIPETLNVIKEVGAVVPAEGLLMDLTSVKRGPVEAMLNYSRAQVVGVHPLFGPDIWPDSGLRVALCPGRGERGLRWIKDIFLGEGIKVTILEPEEHDRMMGLIQGVNHFSTLALARCISRSGFEFEDLKSCSTQTFEQRIDRIRSMMEQSPELFGSLLMDNPWAENLIEQYLESVEYLIGITRKGDRAALDELFESMRSFFGTD
jgi:prephenate dehydrogenase